MNASYRLNTCKSNGVLCFGSKLSGKRVSNTYPTFPLLGYSLSKGRVIPDIMFLMHIINMKDLSVRVGDAFH